MLLFRTPAFQVERLSHANMDFLCLHGRFVFGEGADRDLWAMYFENGSRRDVILDMDNVTHLDASGLGVLVDLYRKAHERGGKMIISGASRRVQEMLGLTRLDGVFTIN